jgi:hypothetical protein
MPDQIDSSNSSEKLTRLTKNELSILSETMLSRRRFTFTHLDALYGIFCPIKSRLFCCRGKRDSVYDNYMLYKKGVEKFYTDWDIASLINTTRRLGILSDLLLTPKQQKLEVYSRQYLLNYADKDLVEHWKRVPKYKGRQGEFENTAGVNGIVDRLGRVDVGKWDRMILEMIDGSAEFSWTLREFKSLGCNIFSHNWNWDLELSEILLFRSKGIQNDIDILGLNLPSSFSKESSEEEKNEDLEFCQLEFVPTKKEYPVLPNVAYEDSDSKQE